MQLTCQKCGYKWNYRGSNKFYTNCPKCLSKIRITAIESNDRKSFPIEEFNNYFKSLDEAQQYGVKYVSMNAKCNIEPNGDMQVITKYTLEALRDGVATQLHEAHSTGYALENLYGEIPDSLNPEIIFIEQVDEKRKTYFDILDRTTQHVQCKVRFAPPLDKGEIISYEIKAKHRRLVCMCKEDIQKSIMRGKWPSNEISEWKAIPIRHPTDFLSIEVALPIKYPIEDAFPDVTLINSYDIKIDYEIKRITDKALFNIALVRARQILKLEVPAPNLGLVYWVKWVPPSIEPFEKWYSQNTQDNK